MANVHELISEEVFRICFFPLSFNLLFCCFLVSELLFIIQRFLTRKRIFSAPLFTHLLTFRINFQRWKSESSICCFCSIEPKKTTSISAFFFVVENNNLDDNFTFRTAHPPSSQYAKANLGWGIKAQRQECKGFNVSLHRHCRRRYLQ